MGSRYHGHDRGRSESNTAIAEDSTGCYLSPRAAAVTQQKKDGDGDADAGIIEQKDAMQK
ncbi:hypothetical protein DPMN_154446 [Dreissena polymorpha]|uniref:Uncharacterized protein n=1 Tax=Dreissena polymorpha TaxID=45954 RepID=A0A9D4FP86_DREPO|nr:hypothetical protein DPMN_154446 [Dreissena polymorpha]